MTGSTGKLDEFAPDARVIHIDIDPAEISKLRSADVSLPGEIRPVLQALSGLPPVDRSGWLASCQANRDQNKPRYDYPGEDIYAPLLLKELSTPPSNRIPGSAATFGQHQMWVAQHCHFALAEKQLVQFRPWNDGFRSTGGHGRATGLSG